MTTAEAMAVAVLKGDLVAARALADLLAETVDEVRVLPVVRVADPDRIKAMVFFREGTAPLTPEASNLVGEAVLNWLRLPARRVLTVQDVDRIELYEVPAVAGSRHGGEK